MNKSKKWCLRFVGITVACILILLGISEALLHRINEGTVGSAVVDRMEKGALYGSALNDDVTWYKLQLIKRQQPDIVALGSSRAWQFRRPFFKDSFYSMGYTVSSIDHAIYIFNQMRQTYTPKVIIFCVDLWWLNPNHKQKPLDTEFANRNELEKRLYMYGQLYTELRRNPKLRSAILHPDLHDTDTIGARHTVGLVAAARAGGNREDGSYQYGETIINPGTAEDRIADTKDRIEKGEGRFNFADAIDYDRLAKLKGLIHEMNNAGCTVIVCLPPFAHEIYSMMAASDGHKHLLQSFEQSVHQAADDEGVYFFDYSDMAWLGATDDEALDGFHGSERVYARMCLSMSSNPELQWMFDTDYLKTHLASPVDDMHIVPFDEMHYVK